MYYNIISNYSYISKKPCKGKNNHLQPSCKSTNALDPNMHMLGEAKATRRTHEWMRLAHLLYDYSAGVTSTPIKRMLCPYSFLRELSIVGN